jgi:hypothetical protein
MPKKRRNENQYRVVSLNYQRRRIRRKPDLVPWYLGPASGNPKVCAKVNS